MSAFRTIAQARAALHGGRPEMAEELIAPLRYERPHDAATVLGEIARGYILRARRHLASGNPDGAWQDLVAAESLNTGEVTVAELRADLFRQGLTACREAFDAGDPFRVLGLAQSLRDRRCSHPQLAKLHAAAQDWVQAREMADRGDFALSRQTIEAIRQKMGFLPVPIEQFDSEVNSRHGRFATAFAELSKAAMEHRLEDAIRWADDALNAAPTHRPARQYRDDVWAKLKVDTRTHIPSPSTVVASVESAISVAGGAASAVSQMANADTTAYGTPKLVKTTSSMAGPVTGVPKRFYLWVDGGGGYLVCTGTHATIGQAAGDAPIDIPIFADLAKVHATLSRDAEGYVLESSRGVSVNGVPVTRAALKPGDRVTLGATCQFTFQQSSPLTPTARLDLISGHRFQMAVDAVILMADLLLLGPSDETHVPLSSKHDVALYRGPDGMAVRCPGSFRVDTFQFQERANLRLPANITAEGRNVSFHLEPAGRG